MILKLALIVLCLNSILGQNQYIPKYFTEEDDYLGPKPKKLLHVDPRPRSKNQNGPKSVGRPKSVNTVEVMLTPKSIPNSFGFKNRKQIYENSKSESLEYAPKIEPYLTMEAYMDESNLERSMPRSYESIPVVDPEFFAKPESKVKRRPMSKTYQMYDGELPLKGMPSKNGEMGKFESYERMRSDKTNGKHGYKKGTIKRKIKKTSKKKTSKTKKQIFTNAERKKYREFINKYRQTMRKWKEKAKKRRNKLSAKSRSEYIKPPSTPTNPLPSPDNPPYLPPKLPLSIKQPINKKKPSATGPKLSGFYRQLKSKALRNSRFSSAEDSSRDYGTGGLPCLFSGKNCYKTIPLLRSSSSRRRRKFKTAYRANMNQNQDDEMLDEPVLQPSSEELGKKSFEDTIEVNIKEQPPSMNDYAVPEMPIKTVENLNQLLPKKQHKVKRVILMKSKEDLNTVRAYEKSRPKAAKIKVHIPKSKIGLTGKDSTKKHPVKKVILIQSNENKYNGITKPKGTKIKSISISNDGPNLQKRPKFMTFRVKGVKNIAFPWDDSFEIQDLEQLMFPSNWK